MSEPPLAVVILAAGQGTRMHSALPKVLHPVAGRPMLAHVLGVAAELNPVKTVVVVAPGAEAVAELAEAHGAIPAMQERQLGTGHAVASAEPALLGFEGTLLVLFGDTPLLTAATLRRLVALLAAGAGIAALGFRPADPAGYGRMICKGDRLLRIVEHRDATPGERRVGLCFAGMLAASARPLFDLLCRVENRNDQGEYYLTDAITIAQSQGMSAAVTEGSQEEMLGVNSRVQLAQAESAYQARRRKELMDEGVGFAAPETVFLSADTVIEPEAVIGPYVVFGPGVKVRRGAEIRAFCHIEGAEICSGAVVGPFARLRPGALVKEGAHVGNFVEVKNAILDQGAKANHLAYLGDVHVGAEANIGAGAITCNYDGVAKHRTDIGAGAFIGSNAALVAPVKIGEGAIVGAGSVITSDVAPGALALGRARQTVKPGMAKQIRARNAARKKKG